MDVSEIFENLNEPQRNSVTSESKNLLVLAGAGSGKTRVITHRIAYLIESLNIDPHRILAVTFTNKAAKEMRERIHQLLGDKAISLSMGTFHSICARILRVDGNKVDLPTNFVIYDTADQLALIRQIQSKLNIDSKKFPPRQILSTISSAKNKRFTDSTYQKTYEISSNSPGSRLPRDLARYYNRFSIPCMSSRFSKI